MDIQKLRNQHAMIATDLLVVFRKHDFLQVASWADPEGIASVIAGDMIVEISNLLDRYWHKEPILKTLESDDIFSVRSELERFIVLSLMGNTAKILDLLDFEEKMITIQRNREYVVWGNIKKED